MVELQDVIVELEDKVFGHQYAKISVNELVGLIKAYNLAYKYRPERGEIEVLGPTYQFLFKLEKLH